MNICLVSQEYPPDTAHGGIGTQTFAKAHGLAAQGHRVHVLSHSSDGHRHDTTDGPVSVTRIPGPDARLDIRQEAVRWLAHSEDVAITLDALHREHHFDVVEGPEYGGELFTYLVNRSPDDPPAVVHLHGPLAMLADTLEWPDRDSLLYSIGTMMEGTAVKLADAVYSSSLLSAQWCARHYGLSGSEIPVMHAGVDTAFFRPMDVDKESRPTIVFVGKIGSSKGADVLVEAVLQIAPTTPDLRLRLFGSSVGNQARDLVQFATDAGFPDLVELAGYLDRRHMPTELSRCHVFAAPSPYEGGPGFVYLEAMACGLPVVACSGSGIDEIVTDGENGLLVPPGDVDALAEALFGLLAEPRRRTMMGRAARAYATTRADTKRCVGSIAGFLQSVADAGRR